MPSLSLAQRPEAPTALFAVLHQLLADAVSTLDQDRDGARNSLSRAVELLNAEHAAKTVADSQGGLAPWQAKLALRQINAGLEQDLTVEDLAKAVRLSRSRFSRAFKVTFQISPQRYIVKHRVEKAQEIMRTTEETLSQVAIACGFCDQSHFSRVFRQVTGHSPYAWRRAHYQAQDQAEFRMIEEA